MSVYIRLFPGVKFRLGKRGVRASVGPRAARVHVGAGRPGISTGAGPITAYKPVGKRKRRR